jgi:hypothetical protein
MPRNGVVSDVPMAPAVDEEEAPGGARSEPVPLLHSCKAAATRRLLVSMRSGSTPASRRLLLTRLEVVADVARVESQCYATPTGTQAAASVRSE